MIDKTLISRLIYEGREKINKKMIKREELKTAKNIWITKKYLRYLVLEEAGKPI